MLTSTMIRLIFKYTTITIAVLVGLYVGLLGFLTSSFEAYFVYLYKIQMIWFKDLNVPESFGFLRGQTTPFSFQSSLGGLTSAKQRECTIHEFDIVMCFIVCT